MKDSSRATRAGPGAHGDRLAPWEVALLVGAVLAGRLALLGTAPVASDAWVTLRYAQQLLGGAGLVWEPGWAPALGTAAPGWAVLVAGAAPLLGGPLHAARALGIAADVASAALLIALFARRPWAARASLIAFAAWPALAGGPAGAGEGPALLLAALVAGRYAARGRLGGAGCAVALAVALRPEAVLLLPFLAAFAPGARAVARAALPTALVLVAYVLVLRAFYDPPLLLAVPARLAGAVSGALAFGHLAQTALGWPLGLGLAPLAALGARRALAARSGLVLPMGLGAAVLLAGALLRLAPDDPLLHASRAAWILAVGLGVEGLAERAPAPFSRLARAAAPLGLAATLVGVVLTGRARTAPLPAQEHVLAWAHEAELARSALTIYARDGGALGYWTSGRVLDGRGRTWPAVLAMRDRRLLLRHARPDYLLLEVSRADLGALLADDELAREYYPVRRFSDAGSEDLFPDARGLPERAPRDLLLLRRSL